MTDPVSPNPPSPFIAHWVQILAAHRQTPGFALDLACGRGRHVAVLSDAGFRVAGIDIQLDALRAARGVGRGRVGFVCADLEQMVLPRSRFDVIVVTRYLDRALFPSLVESLAPFGVLLYETFTENQLRYDRGPRSRDHLLAPGELRRLVAGTDVLFDEEVAAPEAVARVAARRR